MRKIFEPIVGAANVFDSAEDMAPYLHEQRGRWTGVAAAVVRPGSTEEVAAVVKACVANRIPLVPQGGNTGLAGGGVPSSDTPSNTIVVSLARMNRIRELDAGNHTMSVDAGVILQVARNAADEADRFLPLSLGAEGSCTIGGNLATNAGGHLTLRWGNARDLVLGLEVVLADGRIWNGMRRLRKDNTGYALRELFLGSEGTLGLITGAVIELSPKPREIATALIGLADPAASIELLSRLRAATGDQVAAFELMPRIGIEFARKHIPGTVDPLAEPHPWYVLAEVTGGIAGDTMRTVLEETLADAVEAELVRDATIAASGEARRQLWFIREAMVDAQKFEGGSIKHDVSVPVSAVATFIERATAAVERHMPGIRPVPFGHVGDGNIHLNLTQPEGADKAQFMARWDEINEVVYPIVADLDGSISAEHGVGRFKVDQLPGVKSPVELELMQKLKDLFDPLGILNPGAVLKAH